ncbi:MAG: MdtA/MuxA family multidrug efflux RND transporter periplasmic adaptor subunit [Rhizobiaceae bacterium]
MDERLRSAKPRTARRPRREEPQAERRRIEAPPAHPAPLDRQAARQGRNRGWLPWAIFLLVVAAVGAYLWQRPIATGEVPHQRRMMQPSSIGIATVGKGDMDVTLDALGTVTSLATVTIKSQITGQLTEVDFKEGQDVRKGDLLAQIDPRPYQAALAQAQGQLARDQALLNGAQVDLARYKSLAAQNAIPHQTLDTQIALVAQYEGTIEADKATVQAATVNLAYCRIVAPVDGRAGLRQVDPGNYVTPSDTSGIVVITQIQPISVLFTIPEDELQAVAQRLHQGAVLPVAAYDRTGENKLADGRLETFDSQIDPTTGTIKLRATFPNEGRLLYPNQFVNVELLVDEHKDVAIIPTAAVQRGQPGTFAYVVNADSTVSVRNIELGVTNGDRVEVRSGLSTGERVVVDGADKLRDGAKVHVRDAKQGQAGSPGQVTATNQQNRANGQNGQSAAPPKHNGQRSGKHHRQDSGQARQ